MSLSLVSANCHVSLDDVEGSLFAVLKEWGIHAPEYDKIVKNLYGTSRLSSSRQVGQLLTETLEIQRLYRDRVAKHRKIRATNPEVRRRILAELLSTDPFFGKLNEIVKVCEDAIATTGVLVCIGD